MDVGVVGGYFSLGVVCVVCGEVCGGLVVGVLVVCVGGWVLFLVGG